MDMDDPKDGIPGPDTLFAAALYLATSYAKTGCPVVCRMLMRQLACILNHPSEEVSPALREACRKLHADWGQIATDRAAALHDEAGAADRRRLH